MFHDFVYEQHQEPVDDRNTSQTIDVDAYVVYTDVLFDYHFAYCQVSHVFQRTKRLFHPEYATTRAEWIRFE